MIYDLICKWIGASTSDQSVVPILYPMIIKTFGLI